MSIILSCLFVSNIVLMNFIGSDVLLMKDYDKIKDNNYFIRILFALMSISSVLNYFVYSYILKNLNSDAYVLFAFSVNIIVSYVLLYLFYQYVYLKIKNLNTYVSYIFMNSLVLGISILNINQNVTFWGYLFRNIMSVFGFYLVFYLILTIKDKIDMNRLPKGISIEVIILTILGILSMVFTGLSGI